MLQVVAMLMAMTTVSDSDCRDGKQLGIAGMARQTGLSASRLCGLR